MNILIKLKLKLDNLLNNENIKTNTYPYNS